MYSDFEKAIHSLLLTVWPVVVMKIQTVGLSQEYKKRIGFSIQVFTRFLIL
jgi:hypothetical protein